MIKNKQYPLPLNEIKDQLTKNAPTIFEEAIRNKSISTDQISQLIHPKYRSGKNFSDAMDLLTKVFIGQGIFVTYTPVITKNYSIIKGVKLNSQNEIKKDSELPIRQLTEKDFSFEKLSRNNSDELITYEEKEVSELYWLEERMKHRVLTKEAIYELIELAQNGSIQARNMIIVHNQRLVRMVAVRYRYCKILEITDLIQEGTFGLIRAIEKFDRSFNLSFSTYAMHWIRQRIYRAIQDYDDLIRIPVHVNEELRKTRKALKQALRDEDGEAIIRLERDMVWLRLDVASLDKAIGGDEFSDTLEDTIADVKDAAVDIVMEAKEELFSRVRAIHDLITSVTMLSHSERNKKIFFMRYGLNGEERYNTLEDIGDLFGITRERVRQVVARIWKSLEPIGSAITEDTIDKELKVIFHLEKITHRRAKLYTEKPKVAKSVIKSEPNKAEVVKDRKIVKVQLDHPLISKVVKLTSNFYGVPVDRIFADTNNTEFTRARQTTLYVLMDHCKVPYDEIALRFDITYASVKQMHVTLKDEVKKQQAFESEIEFVIELLNIKK